MGFWRSAGPARWYARDEELDREIADRFASLHEVAAAGELDDWAHDAEGALALLLLLDQFSRNMFRGTARAFAQDERALRIAHKAIAMGLDREVEPELSQFFYLPLMHSESLADQALCVRMSHALPGQAPLPYALEHERIIRRFGRFPHRNPQLQRFTSPAERGFLDGGGFAG
jgi:uncharacterized protein (DUF924 family)